LKAPKNVDIGKDGFEDLDKFWDVAESKLSSFLLLFII